MEDIESLEQKLQELEAKIREIKQRLSAHSVKPPIMMELFALEDAYAEILRKIDQLKS